MSERFRLRPTIELRQIRSFVTLAQELNFHKAAERLFITQPSLSHQIALLEATIGVRLFQRDRKRVALTDAGRAILDDAQHLLAQLDMVIVKARRIAAVDSATLRVGFPEYAKRTFIPGITAAFRSRNPEVKLTLTEGYSRALLPELRHGRLDVGFVSPAFSNGVVYCADSTGYVYAIRADSGSVIWRSSVGGIVTSSPALSDGILYVASDSGQATAIDAYTGHVLWNRRVGKGFIATPAVAGSTVYFLGSTALYALKSNGGDLVWSESLKGGLPSPALGP